MSRFIYFFTSTSILFFFLLSRDWKGCACCELNEQFKWAGSSAELHCRRCNATNVRISGNLKQCAPRIFFALGKMCFLEQLSAPTPSRKRVKVVLSIGLELFLGALSTVFFCFFLLLRKHLNKNYIPPMWNSVGGKCALSLFAFFKSTILAQTTRGSEMFLYLNKTTEVLFFKKSYRWAKWRRSRISAHEIANVKQYKNLILMLNRAKQNAASLG